MKKDQHTQWGIDIIDMKAKKIYESIKDILRPKSEEEIYSDLGEIKELLEECYYLIESSDDFIISSNIGLQKDQFGQEFYGFVFENLNNNNEYLLEVDGNILKLVIRSLIDYSVHDISSLNNFMFLLGLFEPVNEDLNDLLKPKSDNEMLQIVEEKYPIFIKIFKELFPNKLQSLQSIKNKEPFFTFQEGEITFLVGQSKHLPLPKISYLEKRGHLEGPFSGFFKESKYVSSKEDVLEYVNNKLNENTIFKAKSNEEIKNNVISLIGKKKLYLINKAFEYIKDNSNFELDSNLGFINNQHIVINNQRIIYGFKFHNINPIKDKRENLYFGGKKLNYIFGYDSNIKDLVVDIDIEKLSKNSPFSGGYKIIGNFGAFVDVVNLNITPIYKTNYEYE